MTVDRVGEQTEDESPRLDFQPDRNHVDYAFINASTLRWHTLSFRGALIACAYLTVALCNWLGRYSPHPLLEAIAPAAGLTLGFLALRLVDFKNG